MAPDLWQKALILESQFATLEGREVWAKRSQPILNDVYYASGKVELENFFLLNLLAPGSTTKPLGITEKQIQWLDRGAQDFSRLTPPIVPAEQWTNPSWLGL